MFSSIYTHWLPYTSICNQRPPVRVNTPPSICKDPEGYINAANFKARSAHQWGLSVAPARFFFIFSFPFNTLVNNVHHHHENSLVGFFFSFRIKKTSQRLFMRELIRPGKKTGKLQPLFRPMEIENGQIIRVSRKSLRLCHTYWWKNKIKRNPGEKWNKQAADVQII